MSYKVKLSLVGDFGVGKSSILNVLNNKMDYCCQSTLGVDFFYKNFTKDNKTFKFHIWDTAGQERFRAIVRSYFRDLDVIIMVYDVTDMYGLENIEKWDSELEHINKNNNIIKILVANKIDSPDRYINTDAGKKKALEYNYEYFETSCKDKKTVDHLFKSIVDIVSERNITHNLQLKKIIDYKEVDKNKYNQMIKKQNKKFWCSIL